MKKEIIIKDPIFLTDLLRDLLKAGIITRYEKISDIEWRVSVKEEVREYDKNYSEDMIKVINGEKKLSDFRKEYGIGDPNF